MFVLDTNVVSILIRGGYPIVRKRFLAATPSQCRISVITEAELRFGVARTNWPEKLSTAVGRFIATIRILPWTSREAEAYVELRLNMSKRGISLSPLDALIAAQAVGSHAVLVTADKAFGHVPGLSVENWAD